MRADLVGSPIAVSSPQGRFAAGAALLDGRVMTTASAVGKQLLVAFAAGGAGPEAGSRSLREAGAPAEDDVRWLRVHLGLYGAWDFQGQVSAISPGADPAASLGAPRRRPAVRMGEGERALARSTAPHTMPGTTPGAAQESATEQESPGFPPAPVGQVRVRLLTARTVADLRGPTACEVVSGDDVAALVHRAGPDPRVDAWPDPESVFVQRLTSRATPVGALLMDQSVVSGIGNVYRAEMLFRARLDPHTPGRQVPAAVARDLWRDWVELLDDGVRTGVMVTREDLDDEGRRRALADPAARHAVYRRTGEPCPVCGTPVVSQEMAGRSLYWCPSCQV